jgi:CBS domain-containing protein
MLRVQRTRRTAMLGIRATDAVGTIVSTPVATVRPTATLREAARLLAADRVGLLVVLDHRGVRGVLSERDLVTAVADGEDVEVERVADYLVDDLVTVDESVTIDAAARTMSEAELRHLTVSRDGEVIGVISIRDVVAALLEESATKI